VRQKHAWWYGAFEVHDAGVEGPFPHGDDRFALIFDIDATNRATGERTRMKEVAVYHVRDGRIVREEFFYA
jgi:ketosteroid isomerase-like protein